MTMHVDQMHEQFVRAHYNVQQLSQFTQYTEAEILTMIVRRELFALLSLDGTVLVPNDEARRVFDLRQEKDNVPF